MPPPMSFSGKQEGKHGVCNHSHHRRTMLQFSVVCSQWSLAPNCFTALAVRSHASAEHDWLSAGKGRSHLNVAIKDLNNARERKGGAGGGEVVEDHRESSWKTQSANARLKPLELESIFLRGLFKESEGSGRGERRGARSLARTLTRSRVSTLR